jgi:hypothetical protein
VAEMAAGGAEIEPASGAAVWTGADQAARDWILVLSDAEQAEIVLAGEAVRDRPSDAIDAAAFPLPLLAPKLAAAERTLAAGSGFVMLRGLPVETMDRDLIEIAYWGLGAHLGVRVSQSVAGDRLGHVFDRGAGDQGRYYTRGGALEFHMDPVDVVGLLCVRAALSGGASRIVSAGALHEAIRAERPDLLRILYRGFHNSRRGHGEASVSDRVPVFARGADGLNCCLLPAAIRQAADDGYPLDRDEEEALLFLAEVANRPGLFLDMDFRPGDIQFLNNRTVLHARTDYVDHPDPARKRHLLRLWLMRPDWPARPAAMSFHDRVDHAGGGVRPALVPS